MSRHEFVASHEWKPPREPFPWGAVNRALVVMTVGLWLVPWGTFLAAMRLYRLLKTKPVSEGV